MPRKSGAWNNKIGNWKTEKLETWIMEETFSSAGLINFIV